MIKIPVRFQTSVSSAHAPEPRSTAVTRPAKIPVWMVCDANSDPPGECVAIAVEQGTLCEDDLICTLETVCDGSGGCNGGNQKDAAVCEQELNNDDPCLVGACHEPQGCVLEAANEGMECDLTGAFAQCLEGECSKIHCLDGYDDCDDATPGCETAVHFDPNNCGKCSEICNLEQSLDTCYLGSCVIVECKDDYANCDQEHDTGCEVPLLEDPEHCGECGLVCESTAVSQVGICLLGLCAETECPEGAIDGDGMPGNGCEIQNIVFVDAANIDDPGQTGATDHAFATIQQGVDAAQPGFTVFVRDGNYAETVIINGKDSLLLTGESQDFVHLSVPEYETGIEVTSNDVTVQNMTINGGRIGLHFKAGLINPLEDGLATSLTFIDILAPNNTDTDAAAVMIEYATDIVVSDILVDGVTAGYGKNLRVSISSPCLQADRGGIGAGIRLTGAANCNLTGNIISAIKGGAGGQAYAWSMDHSGSVPGYAGPAAGIYLETSVAIAVSDNILTDCTGGKGGHAGWLTGLNPGTAGGVGSGVYLVATSDSTIHGNTIQTMTGGEGGSQSGHMCGVGGVAAGVYLADSTGNTLTANTITSLTGGTPGYFSAPDFYFPPSQEGYGIYLDNDSLDNSVENSNTMTEEPIVFLYNGNGESISGYQLTADVNPTNWGKIAVFNSTDITVSNNTISGYKGQMAQTVGCLDQPGVVAGEGVGIRVEECLNCTVVDNVVNSIEGGTGGPHMSPVHPGSTGAEGTGILVRASNNTEVTGNEVSSVMGGRGAFRRHSTNEGTGGRGSGILIHQGEDHSVSNNRVAEISGGPGGYVYGTPAGKGGRGSGIVLEDVSKTSLSGNMIVQVEGGAAGTPVAGGTYTPGQSDGADGLVSINSSVISILNTTIGKVGRGPDEGMNPVSTGLHLENSSQVTIQHLTCTEIGSLTGETGHGVSVGTLPSSPVQILDSIITDVSGYCLWNHENNSQLYLKADYTDLNQCTSGEQSNAVVQSHCLAVDPLFFNPAAALYTLKSDSLCIDSGHPDSPYDNELDPNGCNANMGAFGNTEEAASAIGAQHCE